MEAASLFSPSLQLFTVRQQLAEDSEKCLKTLSNMGIQHVEGFDLTQLGQLKPLLDEYGIDVKSSFLCWSHITGRSDLAEKIQYPWLPSRWGIEYAIEQALELGLDTIVNGFLLPEERESLDDFKRFADQLEQAGEKCQAAGLDLLYHNHAFEFVPIDNVIPYFLLLERTERVGMELDVFWTEMANYSATRMMADSGSRVKQLHLKTAINVNVPHYDEQTLPEACFDCPLGQGVVDINAVLLQATQQGIKRVFIEQDHGSDIYRTVSSSADYLSRWSPV